MKTIYTMDGVVDYIDDDGDYEVTTDTGDYCIPAAQLTTKLKIGDKVRATITLLEE